jgi:hypothetical protein
LGQPDERDEFHERLQEKRQFSAVAQMVVLAPKKVKNALSFNGS